MNPNLFAAFPGQVLRSEIPGWQRRFYDDCAQYDGENPADYKTRIAAYAEARITRPERFHRLLRAGVPFEDAREATGLSSTVAATIASFERAQQAAKKPAKTYGPKPTPERAPKAAPVKAPKAAPAPKAPKAPRPKKVRSSAYLRMGQSIRDLIGDAVVVFAPDLFAQIPEKTPSARDAVRRVLQECGFTPRLGGLRTKWRRTVAA